MLWWNNNTKALGPLAQIFLGFCILSLSHALIFSGPKKLRRAIGGVFTSALNRLEGSVASKKVNANRDKNAPKFTVVADEDYSNDKKKQKHSSFDHSVWDEIVKKYVSPGRVDGITTNVVDYVALANDPNFDQYCLSLSKADLSSMHPNELLALYINAYNALCIDHVVRYYRKNKELPASVTNATPRGNDKEKKKEVWDIDAGVVGGETVSLNDIEHKILRSKWDEPRVHASIVCASASCPNLRQEAFVASKINQQMDDQAQQWMADTTKGLAIDDTLGEATFSRIFLWFKGDFAKSGGVVAWAQQYMPKSSSKTCADLSKLRRKYFPYNWNLNIKK